MRHHRSSSPGGVPPHLQKASGRTQRSPVIRLPPANSDFSEATVLARMRPIQKPPLPHPACLSGQDCLPISEPVAPQRIADEVVGGRPPPPWKAWTPGCAADAHPDAARGWQSAVPLFAFVTSSGHCRSGGGFFVVGRRRLCSEGEGSQLLLCSSFTCRPNSSAVICTTDSRSSRLIAL